MQYRVQASSKVAGGAFPGVDLLGRQGLECSALRLPRHSDGNSGCTKYCVLRTYRESTIHNSLPHQLT